MNPENMLNERGQSQKTTYAIYMKFLEQAHLWTKENRLVVARGWWMWDWEGTVNGY